MPRSGSGSYTLPTGNPVVSGTTIEASWANNTLNDVATTLTDSLSRSGQGGMTAAFRAADGSASVPGVAWSSETGTGFYRAGSGDTRFVVSTTEVQKWLSTGTAITGTLSATGNLSTGTASPVFGSGSGVEIERAGIATLRLENSSASNSFELYADSAANGINLRGRDSSPMNFWTGNTLQATLDASGNLGIGTGLPAYRLQLTNTVASNFISVVSVNTGTAGLLLGDTDSATVGRIEYDNASNFMALYTSGTEMMRLDSSGNVGIGTSSPGARLDVQAPEGRVILTSTTGTNASYYTAVNTGGSFFIGRDNSSGGLSGTAYAAALISTGAYPMVFGTNSAEKMRLDSSGNLGIGTSSPGTRLHIQGADVTARIQGTTSTGIGSVEFFDDTAASHGQVWLGGSAYSSFGGARSLNLKATGAMTFLTGGYNERMRLDSSGNLGLGVTPSAWGTFTAAQIGATASLAAFTGQTVVGSNWYYNSGDKYLTTDYASVYSQSLGQHRWYTAPSGTAGNAISFTQAMTLDASGNLGVGTASPTQRLEVVTTSATVAKFTRDLATDVSLTIGADNDGAIVGTEGVNVMRMFTAGTERARITSGGDLLVGATSSDGYRLKTEGSYPFLAKGTGGAALTSMSLWNDATTGDNIFVVFSTETGGTTRGSIDYNRAGGLVRYNTTSDYRAKDIIGPVQNPGATIDALKVYEGKMKGATQSRPMLVAHEAQAHAPYAVSGVKDEVNEDGTPKFQQMDVSSLVPLLLAEIQSLRARVAQLEAKV